MTTDADGRGALARRARVADARDVLAAIGMPREQLNDRSALVLLALAGLPADRPWIDADSRLLGVTPIMQFISDQYGIKYAPNSRETVRRFTLHQFTEAGVTSYNPDKPDRPVNSPRAVYGLTQEALRLVRSRGTESWAAELERFHAVAPALSTRYALPRHLARVPVKLPDGGTLSLSPGGQSPLMRAVVEEFLPRFTPGATVLYLGDTEGKWACFAKDRFAALGVVLDDHGKMPDVAILWSERNWLVIVEAVTSHGPMSQKRVEELNRIFAGCSASIVYVTALPDFHTFTRYARAIAWETEVWISANPEHMIHFNGDRFLGPRPRVRARRRGKA